MRKVACVGTVLGLAFLALGGVAVRPALAQSSEEQDFVSRINSSRAKAGLPPYSVASDLVAVARRHSQEMASQGRIYHNAELGSEVSGWRSLGENVGKGPSVDSLHEAFMASEPHRENILDRAFTQVGVGVSVTADGIIYVTEVFREPAGAPAPQPAPAAPRNRGGSAAPVAKPRVQSGQAARPSPSSPASLPRPPAPPAPAPPAPGELSRVAIARLVGLERGLMGAGELLSGGPSRGEHHPGGGPSFVVILSWLV